MMPPDLSFALPLGSETRWSDLLAVLIATFCISFISGPDVIVAFPASSDPSIGITAISSLSSGEPVRPRGISGGPELLPALSAGVQFHQRAKAVGRGGPVFSC